MNEDYTNVDACLELLQELISREGETVFSKCGLEDDDNGVYPHSIIKYEDLYWVDASLSGADLYGPFDSLVEALTGNETGATWVMGPVEIYCSEMKAEEIAALLHVEYAEGAAAKINGRWWDFADGTFRRRRSKR